MKIAIFTSRLIYGGGEKVQNWLAQQLFSAGIEVIYLTPQLNNDYLSKLRTLGLENKVVPVEYPHYLKIRHPLTYVKSIKKIYVSNKIDVILIFGGSLIEEYIAHKLGIKVILSERCNPSSRPLHSRILKLFQYRLGDRFVFQTKEQSLFYSNYAQNNCEIIMNPIVDFPVTNQTTKKKEIVTVGRLSREKNINGIVLAFNKFLRENNGYKLLIYGSGPQEKQIRALIGRLQIEKSVEIIQGKSNIAELIQGSSMFILNSISEGMPNALIEAMSVGIPCISTDCPIYGPRALIENGVNGFLVPMNDPETLFKKMMFITNNPDEASRIGENALKIRNKLDPSYLSKKWIECIKKTMG